MSPSAYITVRTVKKGRRFVVRYRTGGRDTKLLHAGSFKTLKDARARRDLVIGWLAAGKDPRAELLALTRSGPARTLAEWGRMYEASRIDVSAGTRENVRAHRLRIDAAFGDRDPASLTPADVQEWIGSMLVGERPLKPVTIPHYLNTLRRIFDFADVEPNPARDRRVKLPAVVKEEPQPPPAAHVLAIFRLIPPRLRLPFIVLEQTAMRVGELTSLAWGDVDAEGLQFRLRGAETKTRRPRWVQLPDWLMAAIEDTCPREDRTPERQVFPGFTGDRARHAMDRACVAAGVPHYHPHDLRHRRASLWHFQGVVAKELAERGGWAQATLPLEVYAHVLTDRREVPQRRWEQLLVRSR